MKNFYLWLVAVMVCVGILPAAAQDAEVANINFTVNIPTAEGITCKVDYVDYDIKQGINEFSVPNGSYVNFYAQKPWQITSVLNKNGTAFSSYYGPGDWYLYVNPAIADEQFTISVVNLDDFRTSQFTLNVDDPSLINAVVDGYYTTLTLKEGTNIVKYDPAKEKTVTISPKNYGDIIYSVQKNGVDVVKDWNSYPVLLEDGCVVDVVAKLPEGDATVNFSFSEGAEAFVTIKVNGEEVKDFDGKSFTVKIGDKVTIEGDRNTYNFEEISINGEKIAFWGSYDFVVVKDTQVYINAHPYGNISATIIINNPQLITITNAGNVLELKEGENVLEFAENNSNLSWTVDPMGIINSVSVNGNEPLYSGQTYYTLLADDVITFDVTEKNFDKQFMVWIDNVDAPSCSGYITIVSQPDRSFNWSNQVNNYEPSLSKHDFNNGYTIIPFYSALNPISLSWFYDYYKEVPEYRGQCYINDVRLLSAYEWNPDATDFLQSINDGDVVKFFFEAAPVECKVSFDIAEGVEASVVKDIITAVEDPAAGFDCFNGTQVVVSGEGLEVKVNGTAVAGQKDEEGNESFTFVVSDPATAVAVAKAGGSAVEAIEAAAETVVFNLQGVRVSSSLKGLAPGIYIVAGKKVVVTE